MPMSSPPPQSSIVAPQSDALSPSAEQITLSLKGGEALPELPAWVTSDPSLIRIEGTVRRVIYSAPDGDFSVIEVETHPHDGPGVARSILSPPVTVVGALAGLQLGEALRVVGRWEHHSQHGRQLRAELTLPIGPQTLTGIERYLTTLSGLGPELSNRIVSRFGLDSLTILENETYRIAGIKGVGKRRAQRAFADARARRQEREVMIFLQGLGISAAYSARIRKVYGGLAVQRVKEDPYGLARDVSGIGFAIADRIARALGVALTSPLRVAAALRHVLEQATDAGHCYLPRGEWQRKTLLLLASEPIVDSQTPSGWPNEALAEAEQSLISRGEIVLDRDPLAGAADVVEVGYEAEDAVTEPAAYSAAMHRSEIALARAIVDALTVERRRVPPLHLDELPFTLAPTQRSALEQVVRFPFCVITGGPGTGKTTIIRALVQTFRRVGMEVRLVAPTGRAAKRLSEATGHAASTVHRLLELRPGQDPASTEGKKSREITGDLFVCDEASMLDLPLSLALFRALPRGATFVLVGDADQLPSVGPGRVLADLIACRMVPVTRLTHIFRQAEGSGIVENAHRILAGQMPVSPASSGGGAAVSDEGLGDFYFIPAPEPAAAQERVLRLVCERIPSRFGFDPRGEIQVLTPMHRGEVGTEELNRALQRALQPALPAAIAAKKTLLRGGRHFLLGDKVMQVKNDRERDVWNGDVGFITSLDPEEGQLAVRFDDEREVIYEEESLDQLEHAYAMSVHKSQGSEYKAVVVPLVMQHYPLLRKNLLYTAVTRGKKLVVLVGDPRALRRAVSEGGDLLRYTRLAARLHAILAP
jgi:exodeoxyribonuclease V alpha subunit